MSNDETCHYPSETCCLPFGLPTNIVQMTRASQRATTRRSTVRRVAFKMMLHLPGDTVAPACYSILLAHATSRPFRRAAMLPARKCLGSADEKAASRNLYACSSSAPLHLAQLRPVRSIFEIRRLSYLDRRARCAETASFFKRSEARPTSSNTPPPSPPYPCLRHVSYTNHKTIALARAHRLHAMC